MKTLRILIPVLEDPDNPYRCRLKMFLELLDELNRQILEGGYEKRVKVISNIDNGTMSIGAKRNQLVKAAKLDGADYIAFKDDDDWPGLTYIKSLMIGIDLGVDVVGLRGVMTTNGGNPEIFEHSLSYKAYKTNEGVEYPGVKYERYPNHLNCMRLDIAEQFPFPEIDHGEDTAFATAVFKSGLLLTEFMVTDIIYHYRYKSNK